MTGIWYLFFISLIAFYLIWLKVIFGINVDSIFKQGKIAEIRAFIIIVPFILAFLTSGGITLFIYSILKIFKVM